MKKNLKNSLYFIVIFSFLFVFLFCIKHKNGVARRLNKVVSACEFVLKTADFGAFKNKPLQRLNLNLSDDERRFVAIGFDDFRDSDFSLIYPMLKKYNATATFNRINRDVKLSKLDVLKISTLLNNGNELGNHTFYHWNLIYGDPLCNGQNPMFQDGMQIPFPSNEQMRLDSGNGTNAFGYFVDSKISEIINSELCCYDFPFDCNWKDLSDEQCQFIREYFSIYADKNGILKKLDMLSNKYLGTKGESYGSWNNENQIYEGGIFSGCKTSSNYEIWDRILRIADAFYKDQYNSDFSFKTWSWPGDRRSAFDFKKDGFVYYDEECTKLKNYLAKFKLSDFDNDVSFTDILRKNGYKMVHDTFFPGRYDGQKIPQMSKQLFLNASLSRKDALTYRTNSSISYLKIAKEYKKENFLDKNYAKQMYIGGGSFFKLIESIRHETANGLVHGEIIDSEDTFSESIVFEEMLKFCKSAGIRVISKSEAYEICFNKVFDKGNLIYNPNLVNSVRLFLPDVENLPANPDGYIGECEVFDDGYSNMLHTKNTVTYTHYGIPIGCIKYSVQAKGTGFIKIYEIKNSDVDNFELIKEINIDTDEFNSYECVFEIKDNPLTNYSFLCEEYGDKIMGIQIEYSGLLYLKKMSLNKLE